MRRYRHVGEAKQSAITGPEIRGRSGRRCIGHRKPRRGDLPLGTTFTYQGDLQQGGVAVDEPKDGCDFEFTLWDADVDGSQVGPTLTPSSLVADGRFTVALDFGPDIFTGEARFMEIAVCCPSGCEGLTTLTPRQELMPAPYSLHTPSAESVPWSGLTDVPEGFADDVDNDALGVLSCASGEIAKWDGAAWVCGEDTDTDTMYDGTDFALSNQSCAPGDVVTGVDATGALICDPDADTDTDTLADLVCANGEVAKWDGAAWVCATDEDTDTDTDTLGTLSCGADEIAKWNSGAAQWECAADEAGADGASTLDEAYDGGGAGAGRTITADAGAVEILGSGGLTVAGTIQSGNSIIIDGVADTITSNGDLELHVNDGRALRLETNATSPNLIGGYSGNSVETGAVGATVAGGGAAAQENRAFDDYATVSGGGNNKAGTDDGNTTNKTFATVSGGTSNTASGLRSTVGGGNTNEASAQESTVAGGLNNTASAPQSTIGGGGNNTASGTASVVGGGSANTAQEIFSTVGGGNGNTASGPRSTIGGGEHNVVSVDFGTIGGGGGTVLAKNTVLDEYGTIGGGRSNSVGINDGNPTNQAFATIAGGDDNSARGPFSTIAGGSSNTANNDRSTVGGGHNNTASGGFAAVFAGRDNIASGLDSVVVAGQANTASGQHATVGGGQSNTASGQKSTVGGGNGNDAIGQESTVGGGRDNTANGLRSIVGGGTNNAASQSYTTVGGGSGNTANGMHSAIAGGFNNLASGGESVVGGGSSNTASGSSSIVAGGAINTASGSWSTIGGGRRNAVSADYGTVAGGGTATPTDATTANFVYDDYGTIGGGGNNKAGSDDGNPTNARYATIGGGIDNTASSTFCTVAGGEGNTASSNLSTVGGGFTNTASGDICTVGGGAENTASGNRATVPGGWLNLAGGDYSFAAGNRAKATLDGMFVWAGGHLNNKDFPTATEANFTPAQNQFLARATGGVVFVSATDANGNSTAGVELAAGGGSWSSLSDRNAKENVRPVDGREVLDKLAGVPVATWNYKAQDESIRHIGPMAQDFSAAFGVGEKETMITTIDADGVALAAIQGLYEMVKDQQDRIAALEKQLADLTAE